MCVESQSKQRHSISEILSDWPLNLDKFRDLDRPLNVKPFSLLQLLDPWKNRPKPSNIYPEPYHPPLLLTVTGRSILQTSLKTVGSVAKLPSSSSFGVAECEGSAASASAIFSSCCSGGRVWCFHRVVMVLGWDWMGGKVWGFIRFASFYCFFFFFFSPVHAWMYGV